MPERHFLSKLPPEAARLLRVVHDLSFARSLDAITAAAGSAARDLTGADGVSFVLRDADHCYYADENAIAPLWKGRRFPLDACISGWVMTHNQPVVIPDIYADVRIPADIYRPTFVKSLAMVPVRAGEAIAAIGAYWAGMHAATDDEIGALSLLADTAALALTNVRLYTELSAALDREKQARISAETAAAAKDEFLALVSHELRQPLHASLAALRLMATHASREAGEHARMVVERQVHQMNSLVEDLVDAARIVRGHVQLNVAPIDLGAAIQHVADGVRPLMDERRHAFAVMLPDRPVLLHADAVRLQQVFTNLLTNAAKYTEPGGRITLAVTCEEGWTTIVVSDTGRGIDAAALPTIFDLFTRAAPDVRGFGVGLAVTRRLVELHGGTIEARSAGPGLGSAFSVSLPLAVCA
jgi:two-component system CheB/CheR fusion protein